ncbi:type III secretion system protein [Yersinia massiliensis]|uniref:InvB/SpaK family type III secretion system chaperone n=1 Tax=Yersinia massiliensis TaxID=419257 RepID=UPI0005E0515F|nr:type III secretion system protein [Yersinia massiliensis]CNH38790.1 type III secretion system protein [Yersinia massiliensis]
MKYRFIEALNTFLSYEGRQDLINTQLDCHSTIQLELNESPPINVDLASEDVILWSNLYEYHSAGFDTKSGSLLSELLSYTPRNFQIGQPALNITNNTFVLSAVMPEAAMNDPQLFSASLEEFYERSHQLMTLLIA